MKTINLLIGLLLISGCNYQKNNQPTESDVKYEITQVEKSFNEDLLENGVAEAFYNYAAPNAVILRGANNLIKGKEGIKKYYSSEKYNLAKAYWKPEVIEISNDGTLASTWGKYKWISADSAGKEVVLEGYFHTVWKKMPDGQWKYIWD
ncbi:hypothetical protein OO013_04435 [Mangrovivirga sp. M17]|uniref:DUF4440 domain-containing protein n=1 Tax=Mangrovivirga halotolerans TaxID=2993936 RepID=A0ABT3RP25_9BACT|nr:DUF4440 domain-containing protein [Mangrovivirga halotolerans]MCX2743098.1 hypothetical protein [Mangrovivirga halotolerans]